MTETKKRRDDDLEQSRSSANALRNASSYWKHIKQQQQQNRVKSFAMVDEQRSKST